MNEVDHNEKIRWHDMIGLQSIIKVRNKIRDLVTEKVHNDNHDQTGTREEVTKYETTPQRNPEEANIELHVER